MSTIHLEVKNVRRVGHARLPIEEGVTLIAGRNAAGKTSLLTALGALLAGERAPFPGGIKFNAEHIVQHGEKEAWATLTNDRRVSPGEEAWESSVTWKKEAGTAELTTVGKPPSVSRLCAGLDLFSKLDTTARLKLLSTVLDATATIGQLQAACPLATPAALKKLQPQVDAGMWPGAHDTADAEAKQVMGAWRQVAGKTWTAKGGREWEPEHLPDDRSVEHLEELRTLLQELRGKVDSAAAGARGITPDARAKLEALVQELPAAKERLAAFRAQLEDADEERQKAQLKLGSTPKPGDPVKTCACPECGVVLDVTFPENLKQAGKTDTKEEILAAKKAYDTAKQAESRAVSAYQGMQRNVEVASAFYGQCQDAAARLEGLGPGGDAPALDDVGGLQVRFNTTLAQGKALSAWLDAKKLDAEVRMWVELRTQLAPEGLRRTALKGRLASFNARLAQWAQDLDGLVLRIDEDMVVRDGNDEPYPMLSGAEKWLSDALVMLAVAEIEQAPVVIIDEGNVLDEYLRPSLLAKVLRGQPPERRIVVACAIGYPEKAPQLAKWKMGKTWWVEEGGVVEDYQREAVEAAA